MPSALHQACARAIADAIAESYNVPRKGGAFYTDDALRAEHQARLAAAVAIRVVMGEAQRSIESLPIHEMTRVAFVDDSTSKWEALGRAEVLAALAALAEEPAGEVPTIDYSASMRAGRPIRRDNRAS